MCGIAGILNRDGAPVDHRVLVDMTRTLIHRGPDEEGYFFNAGRREGIEAGKLGSWEAGMRGWIEGGAGNVGLGHRRLSIIDLSSGQQPLSNEDGTVWVVFNGEIYNFQELKQELETKGHKFRTLSDTETIVHAWEQWGGKAAERFRGMFAIALWDQRRQELWLVRDRVGKKPLYYYVDNKRLVFASEIKALIEHPDINREVNMTSLSDYMTLGYVPSPKTIFLHIQKLPPANYAIIKNGTMKTQSYWDLCFLPDYTLSDNQIIEGILVALDEATRIRMISEVPLGAFLSGGVDSSAVVSAMARASQEPVITNAIKFSHDRYNEAAYSRMVSNQYGTSHNEFQVTPETIPIIETLSWHYDEPFSDSSALPTYYVSKTARKNVTVSLSGDGGDENFAGYSRYAFDDRENRVRNLLPASLRHPVFTFLRDLYPRSDVLPRLFRGKAFITNVARDPVDAYMLTVSTIHDDFKKEILNPDVYRNLHGYRTLDFFKGIYERASAADHLSRLQYLDVKTYLCEDILTKVDRASMAVSLEVRCPLLDHHFMEFAARIPREKLLVKGQGKVAFKKALERHLPKNLLYRPKMGFAVPVREWFRNEIRTYAQPIILDGQATRDYLNRESVQKIWDQHQRGGRDNSPQLWMIMMLNLWAKRFGR